MRSIDEMGMRTVMQQALHGVDDDTHIPPSFDVDFPRRRTTGTRRRHCRARRSHYREAHSAWR